MKWFLWIYVAASVVIMVLLGLGLSGGRERVADLETALRSEKEACSDRTETMPAAKPAGMLGACLEDLEKARLKIAAKAPACPPCPAPEAPPPGKASAAPTQGSVEDPKLSGGIWGGESDKKSKDAKVQSMFVGKLGLSDPEFEKLRMLVCAFKALRASMLEDLADGSRSADQAWSEMAAMRKELADETQALLGDERYAGFRAVGGIGALGENVDCTSP